ncbi:MAG TPA: alpha/beta fold hydrolase [Tepidisphaeraceae bacterium]
MRRLLLPLIGFALYAGGCTQAIADRVLVPMQPERQREWLAEERRKVGHRVGDRMEALDFKSYDNTRLAALVIRPEKLPPRGVIVCLHGLTERKEAMITIAEAFAGAGYVAVAPDLRAHGSSGGRYTSLGYHEKRDMMALLDTLAGQGYDVSHTGVLGGSLGAATALQWAGIDPRVKAVVAVAPFADLRDELTFMYRAHNIGMIKAALLESAAQEAGQFKIADVSPIRAVRTIETPILLAHGRNDDIIPISESRRLFEEARGPVAFQEVEAKHMDIRAALGEPFMRRAIEWMDTYASSKPHPQTPPAWVSELPNRHLPSILAVTSAQ